MKNNKNSIFRCKVHSPKLFTKNKKNYTWKFFSFITGVVDTADKPSFPIISANFQKIWNDPNGILRGQGDTDLWKKLEVENLVSDFFFLSCKFLFKGSLTQDFRLKFFSWISVPRPWVFPWGRFEFFRKFAEIFLNECLSPVSTTPAITCSPVSMTLAKINPCHGFSVIAGDNNIGDYGVCGVYGRVFSWRFEWNYWRLCPTSAAGEIAVLVWSSFAASGTSNQGVWGV